MLSYETRFEKCAGAKLICPSDPGVKLMCDESMDCSSVTNETGHKLHLTDKDGFVKPRSSRLRSRISPKRLAICLFYKKIVLEKLKKFVFTNDLIADEQFGLCRIAPPLIS